MTEAPRNRLDVEESGGPHPKPYNIGMRRCRLAEARMNALTRKERPDRSKIDLHDARQAKGWAHELGIDRNQLRAIVEKVGNSAVAVKKELASQKEAVDDAADRRTGA